MTSAYPAAGSLLGRHVYTGKSKRTRGYFQRHSSIEEFTHVTVRGEVIDTRGEQVKLRLSGNGPEFDDQEIVVPVGTLVVVAGEFRYRTLEEDGDLPGLGTWTQPAPHSTT